MNHDSKCRCSNCEKFGPARATADEADRAEKEPLAERPQGVDVAKLRKDLALYHGLGEQNITALLDELEEAREQIAVFLPTVKVAQRRQDAAEARVAELEQRLRIAGDPDGEERDVLQARCAHLEKWIQARLETVEPHYLQVNREREAFCEQLLEMTKKHEEQYALRGAAELRADALKTRITELERILSAERAEYDWAVKGAKALEARLGAVREWAFNVGIMTTVGCTLVEHEKAALLTILNGGTDGTV